MTLILLHFGFYNFSQGKKQQEKMKVHVLTSSLSFPSFSPGSDLPFLYRNTLVNIHEHLFIISNKKRRQMEKQNWRYAHEIKKETVEESVLSFTKYSSSNGFIILLQIVYN